jgi:hypothetical protein
MSDAFDRLTKELPQAIERLRDDLEHGRGDDAAIRGELAAYRAVMAIIQPQQQPMVGGKTHYPLTGGPPGYA